VTARVELPTCEKVIEFERSDDVTGEVRWTRWAPLVAGLTADGSVV
jgi:hypothetical protein